MKVLVTGATGVIGRKVVHELVRRGHAVVGFDRSLDDRLEAVTDDVRQAVRWVDGDTRDFDTVSGAMAGADAVIHLAAGASFIMYEEDPLEYTSGTMQGFHAAIEAAHRHEVSRFVYASTSAVYEGNPLQYVETMPLRPPDLKALSKKVNEEMAAVYADRYGMTTVAMRPFSVYSEDEFAKGKYANVISLLSWAMVAGRRPLIWGDGAQTRDFVHATDVATAFVLVTEVADPGVPALNVGTGVETSFNEVGRMVAAHLGVEFDPVYVDVPIAVYARGLRADTERCSRVLGFQPTVPVAEGVSRVVERAKAMVGEDEHPALADAQDAVYRQFAQA